MRRLLITALALPLLIPTLLTASASKAGADPTCHLLNKTTRKCVVKVIVNDVPRSDGVPDSVPGVPQGDDGGGSRSDSNRTSSQCDGRPCTSKYGNWSGEKRCYVSPADAQHPAAYPARDAHNLGSGAMYQCARPPDSPIGNEDNDIQAYGTLFWLFSAPDDAPPGGGPLPPPPPPPPEVIAEIAIDRLQMSAVDVGLAPKPEDGSVGLVGMPVWMWADDPDSNTWGPTTASASAGGITVTATAKVESVTWVMGDGTEVVCDTPGTPYDEQFGMAESPDCGHIYQRSSSRQPGGTYTVKALSAWVVEWDGGGESGTVRLDPLERSAEVAIGEAQVLVQ